MSMLGDSWALRFPSTSTVAVLADKQICRSVAHSPGRKHHLPGKHHMLGPQQGQWQTVSMKSPKQGAITNSRGCMRKQEEEIKFPVRHRPTCEVHEIEGGRQDLGGPALQHVQRQLRGKDAVRAAGLLVRLCGPRLPVAQAALQQLQRACGCKQ